MKISYHCHSNGLDLSQGYGIAGFNIVSSLKQMGHEVPFNDPTADVIFNFTQPPYYQFHQKPYTIGYTPWESSEVEDGWVPPMLAVDEMWVPTPQVRTWMHNAGVNRDIKVFEHGLDHKWKPFYRRRTGPLKFLHVGSDMYRKGGQEVFDAFVGLFGRNNPNVQLTLKTHSPWVLARKYEAGGVLYNPMEYSSNINHIHGSLTQEEMIDLFYTHDVFVYPSYGEGFGLLPLQALGTGMVTISTSSWCSYKRFLHPRLTILDELTDSPWPLEHPGQVTKPSLQSLRASMAYAFKYWSELNDRAWESAPIVHEEYDWLKLTSDAFGPVIDHVNSL